MIKRIFDVVASGAALILLAPFLLIVMVAIRLDSPGTIYFRQTRFGRNSVPFTIYKFRSMISFAPRGDMPEITSAEDPRITRIGKFIRKYKIDELPQIWNVLKGDMSVVGPRPEVPKFVKAFERDYKEILKVRPGLTDLSSIEYFDEESALKGQTDVERYYIEKILPKKMELANKYVEERSFMLDIRIIFKTLARIFGIKF